MNRVRPYALVGLLLLFVAAYAPALNAAPAGQSATEIFNLVNQLRAEHGLPPYQYNATLLPPRRTMPTGWRPTCLLRTRSTMAPHPQMRPGGRL